MREAMLTTTDNPFNPFTQWDEWYAYDIRARHFTCNYLARVVITSPDLSPADQALAIQIGIDEIIDEDIFGNYIKVFKDDLEKEKNMPVKTEPL